MRYFLFVLILMSNFCFAQDSIYVRKTLNKLTSKEFWGRGYTKNGMGKAADFIESEFISFGLRPMDGKKFKQDFSFSVNTFPNKMELKINGEKLIPGKDFIVEQASKGINANGNLLQKDSTTFVDTTNHIFINLVDKLTWSVSQKVNNYTQLFIKKSSMRQILKINLFQNLMQ